MILFLDLSLAYQPSHHSPFRPLILPFTHYPVALLLCERPFPDPPLLCPLPRDQQEVSALQEEAGGLNGQISELQRDVEGSREREAELLGFTEKLSSKNAQLQSESNSLQGQLDTLRAGAADLQARLQDTQGLLQDKVRPPRGEGGREGSGEVGVLVVAGCESEKFDWHDLADDQILITKYDGIMELFSVLIF